MSLVSALRTQVHELKTTGDEFFHGASKAIQASLAAHQSQGNETGQTFLTAAPGQLSRSAAPESSGHKGFLHIFSEPTAYLSSVRPGGQDVDDLPVQGSMGIILPVLSILLTLTGRLRDALRFGGDSARAIGGQGQSEVSQDKIPGVEQVSNYRRVTELLAEAEALPAQLTAESSKPGFGSIFDLSQHLKRIENMLARLETAAKELILTTGDSYEKTQPARSQLHDAIGRLRQLRTQVRNAIPAAEWNVATIKERLSREWLVLNMRRGPASLERAPGAVYLHPQGVEVADAKLNLQRVHIQSMEARIALLEAILKLTLLRDSLRASAPQQITGPESTLPEVEVRLEREKADLAQIEAEAQARVAEAKAKIAEAKAKARHDDDDPSGGAASGGNVSTASFQAQVDAGSDAGANKYEVGAAWVADAEKNLSAHPVSPDVVGGAIHSPVSVNVLGLKLTFTPAAVPMLRGPRVVLP